ncbi:hypothetical protein HMPREF9555_01687 [Selenomonas artemidis F0399]|uniref:Uncharacterized protein n=1 Tax=Selenomonas artemidis F0399 TaxID=749551 RepID=E7N3U7_9FIRM|nr:hypothetical protein HMPREF9555_01687 [Selenomonas artemidis F0399]
MLCIQACASLTIRYFIYLHRFGIRLAKKAGLKNGCGRTPTRYEVAR